MKKFLLVLLCIVVFSSISSAQWTQTNGPKGGAVGNILKINNSEYIYTTSLSIFLSKDECKTWKKVYTLPPVEGYGTGFLDIHYFNKKLYVGTYHGLFISDETLENYEQLQDTIFKQQVSAIATDDTAIYVASYLKSGVSGTHNVYASSINNKEWKCLTSVKNGYVLNMTNDIGVKWGKIYVASSGVLSDGKWYGAGMQVTSDNGETWRTINNSLYNINIECIGFNDSEILISNSDGGTYISHDQGENWKDVNNAVLQTGYKVKDIQSNQNYIFVAAPGLGILRSSDVGESWESANKGLQSKNIDKLSVVDNELYASSESGLYKSTDNGDNWVEKNEGIFNIGILDMIVENGTFYTCSYLYGINATSDGGNTWYNLNETLPNKSIYRMAVDQDSIYIGLYGSGGVYMSPDKGSTWKRISGSELKGMILCLHKTEKFLYASSADGSFRTSDNGVNWEPLKFNSSDLICLSDMIHNNQKLFAVDRKLGVLESSDDGTTWIKMNNGILDSNLTRISLSGNKLCVSSYDGKVYISDNLGEDWTRIKSDSVNYYISSNLLLDGKIFIGTSGNNSSVIADGIKMTDDNGKRWFDINNGFGKNQSITKLCVYSDYIYAATSTNSVYKAKISDFDYVGVNDEKPTSNFIIASPPYPLPSKQIVNTLINWSSEIDIANADMTVYNSLGEKVCGKEQICFQQRSPNSGIVTWNAKDNPSGVYFLHITSGNEKKVVSYVIE